VGTSGHWPLLRVPFVILSLNPPLVTSGAEEGECGHLCSWFSKSLPFFRQGFIRPLVAASLVVLLLIPPFLLSGSYQALSRSILGRIVTNRSPQVLQGPKRWKWTLKGGWRTWPAAAPLVMLLLTALLRQGLKRWSRHFLSYAF
jgi:hypothetical protein